MKSVYIRSSILFSLATAALLAYTPAPGEGRETPVIKPIDLRDEYIEQQEKKKKADLDARKRCDSAQQSFLQMQRYGEGGESLFGVDLKGGIWAIKVDRAGYCQLSKDFDLGIERNYQPSRRKGSRKELVLFSIENERLCRYRRASKTKLITVYCYGRVATPSPSKRSLIFR